MKFITEEKIENAEIFEVYSEEERKKFLINSIPHKFWKSFPEKRMFIVNKVDPNVYDDIKISFGDYKDIGIYPVKQYPVFNCMTSEKCQLAFVCGSQIYGLQDENSDYDSFCIGPHFQQRFKPQISYIKNMTFEEFSHSCNFGSRRSLEILFSPEECLFYFKNFSDIEKFNDLKSLITRKIHSSGIILNAHYQYVKKYSPFLKNGFCSDKIILEQIKRNGWAYKIGYYLLIDSIFSYIAINEKCFSIGKYLKSNADLKYFILKCKNGLVLFEEWIEFCEKIMDSKSIRMIKENV